MLRIDIVTPLNQAGACDEVQNGSVSNQDAECCLSRRPERHQLLGQPPRGEGADIVMELLMREQGRSLKDSGEDLCVRSDGDHVRIGHGKLTADRLSRQVRQGEVEPREGVDQRSIRWIDNL